MSRFRILVTGSRNWPEVRRYDVTKDLDHWAGAYGYGGLTVVHGACRTGIDRYADDWAVAAGLTEPSGIERWPADWDRYGNGAGPKRNLQMVNTRPDLVLAYLQPGSRGTWQCVRAAVDANLDVRLMILRITS